MTAMIHKAMYDAFRKAGLDDKTSELAATVENVATKQDIDTLRREFDARIAALREEILARIDAKIDALRAEMYKLVAAQTVALVLAMVGSKSSASSSPIKGLIATNHVRQLSLFARLHSGVWPAVRRHFLSKSLFLCVRSNERVVLR